MTLTEILFNTHNVGFIIEAQCGTIRSQPFRECAAKNGEDRDGVTIFTVLKLSNQRCPNQVKGIYNEEIVEEHHHCYGYGSLGERFGILPQ